MSARAFRSCLQRDPLSITAANAATANSNPTKTNGIRQRISVSRNPRDVRPAANLARQSRYRAKKMVSGATRSKATAMSSSIQSDIAGRWYSPGRRSDRVRESGTESCGGRTFRNANQITVSAQPLKL